LERNERSRQRCILPTKSTTTSRADPQHSTRSRDRTARIRDDGPRNGVHNAAMSIYPAVRCFSNSVSGDGRLHTYSPAVLCICMLII
jgi:hypothetical protein